MRTTLPASRIEAKTMGRCVWTDRDECDVGLMGILDCSGRPGDERASLLHKMSSRFDEMGTITSMRGF